MLFLHFHDVLAQVILSGDLIAIWEVIDFLVLIETFVKVRLASRVTPQHIPIVRFCMLKTIRLENRSNQASLSTEYLVEKFCTLVGVVSFFVVLK